MAANHRHVPLDEHLRTWVSDALAHEESEFRRRAQRLRGAYKTDPMRAKCDALADSFERVADLLAAELAAARAYEETRRGR